MIRWLGVCLLVPVLTSTASAAPPQLRNGLPSRPAPAAMAYGSYYYNPYGYTAPAVINPNYYIAPGLTINQYAYNMAVLGQGLSYMPPWAFGYNPYPAPVINYRPLFPTYVYNPYISPYWNPVRYNPYANFAYGAYYYNPYVAWFGY